MSRSVYLFMYCSHRGPDEDNLATTVTERSRRVKRVLPPVSRLDADAVSVSRREVKYTLDCPSTYSYVNYVGCLLYTSRCV